MFGNYDDLSLQVQNKWSDKDDGGRVEFLVESVLSPISQNSLRATCCFDTRMLMTVTVAEYVFTRWCSRASAAEKTENGETVPVLEEYTSVRMFRLF